MTTHTGQMFDTEELVINMGPQHPSTHGVLRVVLRLDGERVVSSDVITIHAPMTAAKNQPSRGSASPTRSRSAWLHSGQ